MHITIIDIEEQSEVIDFVKDAKASLETEGGAGFSVNAYQLKPGQFEADFDFSQLQQSKQTNLLLMHTKVLRRGGGNFVEPIRLLQILKSLDFHSEAQLYFYSGHIEEFQSYLSLNFSGKPLGQTLEVKKVECKDVFELIYPEDEASFEDWLGQVLGA